MNGERVLCLDSVAMQHPDLIGLDGEQLDGQPWLTCATGAEEARSAARAQGVEGVWVAGCDQMDAINLAAAIKRDGARNVDLVAFRGSGSLRSRASAAGVDQVMDQQQFAQAYAQAKAASTLGRQPAETAPRYGAHASLVEFPPPAQGAGGDASCDVTGPMAPVHAAEVGTAPLREADGAGAVGQAPARSAHLSGESQLTHRAAQGVGMEAPARADAEPGAEAPIADSGFSIVPAQRPAARLAAGTVITVVGAAGGVGKSTISALCAIEAQATGCRTAIVDADLQCGDIHYLLGQEEAMRADALLAAPARIEALVPSGRAPAVLAAPRELERSELVAVQLPQIVDALRARFDCVVVNTSPAWDDLHMDLLGLSSHVLFVLDQRPTGIRLCRHVLDLCTRCGVATQSFLFAVNRCGRQALFSSIDVGVALSGVKAVELLDGGRAVEELLGCGQPLDLVDSRNALVGSLRKALVGLLPVPAGQPAVHAEPERKKLRLGGRGKRAACL